MLVWNTPVRPDAQTPPCAGSVDSVGMPTSKPPGQETSHGGNKLASTIIRRATHSVVDCSWTSLARGGSAANAAKYIITNSKLGDASAWSGACQAPENKYMSELIGLCLLFGDAVLVQDQKCKFRNLQEHVTIQSS